MLDGEVTGRENTFSSRFQCRYFTAYLDKTEISDVFVTWFHFHTVMIYSVQLPFIFSSNYSLTVAFCQDEILLFWKYFLGSQDVLSYSKPYLPKTDSKIEIQGKNSPATYFNKEKGGQRGKDT